MDKEIRKLGTIQRSGDENSRIVEGKAISFNQPSENLGGFIEYIHPEAITQELVDNSDVIAKFNHNDDRVLARWNKGNGSMILDLREDGLYYMFEAPNTTDGNDLLELLKRGDISQSSFAFTLAVDKDSEKWVRNNDGEIERHIYKIGGLYDVSPVFTPAYSSTSCLTRNLSEKLEEIKENDAKLDLILEEIKLM